MAEGDIVVGLYDSTSSRAALRWAARHANATVAPLRAVHVLEWPIGLSAASEAGPSTKLHLPDRLVDSAYRRGMSRVFNDTTQRRTGRWSLPKAWSPRCLSDMAKRRGCSSSAPENISAWAECSLVPSATTASATQRVLWLSCPWNTPKQDARSQQRGTRSEEQARSYVEISLSPELSASPGVSFQASILRSSSSSVSAWNSLFSHRYGDEPLPRSSETSPCCAPSSCLTRRSARCPVDRVSRAVAAVAGGGHASAPDSVRDDDDEQRPTPDAHGVGSSWAHSSTSSSARLAAGEGPRAVALPTVPTFHIQFINLERDGTRNSQLGQRTIGRRPEDDQTVVDGVGHRKHLRPLRSLPSNTANCSASSLCQHSCFDSL